MVPSWGGMQYGALTYNVFVLSTLLFVGQLEPVPQSIYKHEALSVCRIFPGPGNWFVHSDACFFHESLGLPRSVQPLELTVRIGPVPGRLSGMPFQS